MSSFCDVQEIVNYNTILETKHVGTPQNDSHPLSITFDSTVDIKQAMAGKPKTSSCPKQKGFCQPSLCLRIANSILPTKSLSPVSISKRHMVKSTSIIITSTSNECSPVHSADEGKYYIPSNHRDIPINNMFSLGNGCKDEDLPYKSSSAYKAINHNRNWQFFRRDKVAPLKNEDPNSMVKTLSSSISAIGSDSSNIQPRFGGVSVDSINTIRDDSIGYISQSYNDPPHNESSNSGQKNSNGKSFLAFLGRQETIRTGDNDADCPTSSNHAKSSTQIAPFIKSDAFTLSRGSSDLGVMDFNYLSIPQNGSWKNLDDSLTITASPGQMSGSTMSVTRSLGSKIKLSHSEKSSFIFQPSPIGSRRRIGDLNAEEPSNQSCRIANLSTAQGRQWNAAMILGLSVAPIIALLIQNCINLYNHNNIFTGQESVKNDILYSVEIGNVMHFTQRERGTSVLFVSTSGQDKRVNEKLLEAYNNTDKAISQLSKWLSEKDPSHFRTEEAYWSRIKRFRIDLWSGQARNVDTVLQFYSDDNAVIERWIGKSVQLSTNGDLWRTLIGYYMLIISKEQAGVERALGGSFYADGGFTNKRAQHYLQRKVTGLNFFDRAGEYVAEVKEFMDSKFLGTTLALDLSRMREEILRNDLNEPNALMATNWFDNMTEFLDMMKILQDRLAKDIVSNLSADLNELKSKVVEAVVIIVISLLLFPFVVVTVYRLTKRIQAYAEKLHERSLDLDMERKRSEMLLYELLPEQVARKLLNSEEVVPMSFKAVTIFFSDIVGFTSICSRSTPMQVIDMLNTLYRIFDDIISSYRVYKVETIGDAYMVASGVPEQTHEHASEIAGAALDMRDSMGHLMVNHLPDEKLQLRIGINSGPVVAGVVGHKMPRYCLFGDTVNVASRMESTSLPLQIQISESTRLELERWGTFDITPRGNVEIKGKGLMQTHWLTGRGKSGIDMKPNLKQRCNNGDVMFVDDVKM